MKRALIISLAGALAFPIFAGEPKKEAKATASTQATAPAVSDSPLVQAAKRSNRRNGKKTTIVITNESVRSSKGHITTAAQQPAPLSVPDPAPGPEQELAERQAKRASEARRLEAARAEAAAKAKEHRENVRRNATQQVEQGMYESLEGDPASAEHVAETTGDKKPPL
ncbi:MAG TPA: hypothetical protein VF911_02950 [Thermoanaerobaculia bacterium]|jgi:hypothetical protein